MVFLEGNKCLVDLFIKIYWEEKGREKGGGLKGLLRGENFLKNAKKLNWGRE